MSDLVKGVRNVDNIVYHGLNVNDYLYNEKKEDYLLYMGILKFNKGVHIAIEAANKLGMRLIIAGPQDEDDPELTYFNEYIKPKLDDNIHYIGSVAGLVRRSLLSNAKTLLFPTRVETFGLVSIEAMASGTPALFLDTCTGHEILMGKFPQCLCHSIDVYNHVKENFSANKMANNYIRCYRELLEEGRFIKMEKKQTISLVMIAKNEEKNIGNCLDSVRDIVDEIIIVDTGSTDKTKEICSKYTDKIYDFEWIYDFSAARNHALSFATGDYVMFLDCDDIIKEDSRVKLKELKENMDGSIGLYWFYYDYRHDSEGKATYSFLSERLFKNHRGVKWECIVHEVLKLGPLSNDSVKTDIRISHTSNHDNTDTYVNFFKLNQERGHIFNPREKYFYCMELFKHGQNDECFVFLDELTREHEGLNGYEMYSVYGMLAHIYKYRGDHLAAIQNFLIATSHHQPMLAIYYEIADSYRNLGMVTHAKFYYDSIICDLFFKESFTNESVYSNFEADLKEYKVKSLLSLIMLAYHNMNNVVLSNWYNDKLLQVDPTNESGLYNKVFFDKVRGIDYEK
jgi:glycosyltransferase involved in cell wall biosynthesis